MPRIVAAACRIDGDPHCVFTTIFSHADAWYLAQRKLGLKDEEFLSARHEEGFVTEDGVFLSREAAFDVAKANLQATNPDSDYLDALEVDYDLD